ncbi:hypothetical protein CspHIS471_0106750 [Cutaneotrichosporon sp. HIS471]|nr:hypothetical protein CspHIS471_0106750 [Cutaneotrichosporon sp. HIS471]
MASHREATQPDKDYVDPNPMPPSVPHVNELGTTSAPLKSASYFIGDYCREVNEDFMLCKNQDRDPAHCLKEGRKVTRCAQEVLGKIREACLVEFDAHWKCLENNNQYLQACRKQEKPFNQCVFTNFSLKKNIPGAPEGEPQVFEKKYPIFTRVQK